jgi:hypothetical protein
MPTEAIVLEASDTITKNNYSKLIIKRSLNDGAYYCQLSLRRSGDIESNDLNENGEQTSENARLIAERDGVLFRLGQSSNVEKYVQQYVKIVTEEGRRNVKNTHIPLYNTSPNMMHESSQHQLFNREMDVNNPLATKRSSYLSPIFSKLKDSSPVSSGISYESFYANKSQLVSTFL